MLKKDAEKIKAVKLRKDGLSYNEILRKVPVSKSTLSTWLRDVDIAKKIKQRLTEKRKLAQQKAQAACRNNRICREKETIQKARKEIGLISRKDLLIIGAVLYWAEGSKQKEHNVSQRVSFGNSDPSMVLLFIRWIKEICQIQKENLVYSLYIHEKADIEKAKSFWEKLVGKSLFWIYLKKHNPKTTRRNSGEHYYGLLRIDVRRSTDLNRRIKGWVLGILDNLNIETGP